MPIDYKEYPKEWKWLTAQPRKAAGDKCELCFAPNRELIIRDKEYKYPWIGGDDIDVLELDDGEGNGGKKLKKIILTVHHIDNNKKNNSIHNLIVLCQRCHLRLDRGIHLRNRKARRIRELSTTIGKLEL
jgi:hypothetical protein